MNPPRPLDIRVLQDLFRLALLLAVGAFMPAVARAEEPGEATALYKQLFYQKITHVPFRLKFQGYDGDPKKDKIENFSFQINTVDLRRPSEFLKIGDTITHTNFRLLGFTYKILPTPPNAAEEEDVSELTIVNSETMEKIVLTLNKITDNPMTYVQFVYKGSEPPVEFRVKKLGVFVLRPHVMDYYKVVDVKENAVVIELPEGQTAPGGGNTVEIPRDPALK